MDTATSPSRGDLVPFGVKGEEFVTDFLEHFGVKGMHWGQRKAEPSAGEAAARLIANKVGSTVKAFHKENKADIETARAGLAKTSQTKQTHNQVITKVGGLHNISDRDLRLMLNRLDMEKKYSAILHEDRQKRIDGGKALLKVLGKAGEIAVPIILGVIATRAATNAFRGDAPFKVPVVNPQVIEGVARTLGKFPEGH
jgi:hypothetical protein